MKSRYLLVIPILISSLSTNAEITLDGTLGRSGALPGPNYQIGADLGKQQGGNLFHSFQNFNLNRLESATFSGPNNVNSVISRVTGGNPSQIDGLIRSTIPNADMYLLNPYGIMFGENAKLDVQGSFHASTADYLRLGNGGWFDARNPNNSILTVAPVEAFGFLTDSPAKITTQSSQLVVPSKKTLSLIGGDIHLTSDTPLTADNSTFIPTVEANSILAAEHGRVNLVSIASRGEVMDEKEVILQGKGGQITVENTLIEMSGHSGGEVFIRAGQFFLDNSIIRSNTYGDKEGKNINIKLTEAAYINGLNSEISVLTASMNNSGHISIEVPYLEVSEGLITTSSILNGQAGNVKINADNIMLKDGAMIGSASTYFGQSGDIKLEVDDTLSIVGFAPGYRIAHSIEFENAKTVIFSSSNGAGHSGNIFINTKNLNMISGVISTDTHGIGKGGDITINAQKADLIDGSVITSTTYDKGQTGYVKINITDQLYITGKVPFFYKTLGRTWKNPNSMISSSSFGMRDGGLIDIEANNITLTNGGQITASSFATGNAGNISIRANQLQVMDNGQITTSADYAIGGNITLTVPNLLYLQEGVITTSVHGGIGDGGHINISNPQFTVLNQGNIIAQAYEGHGGNIYIKSEQFVTSQNSLVSASSRLGIDGEVNIDSPDMDMEGFLVVLPGGFIEASHSMETLCDQTKKMTHFFIKQSEGIPNSPEDFLPSGPLLSDKANTKARYCDSKKLFKKGIVQRIDEQEF
ncbi:MAG: filamentous hemagglutinin N-terminal domain-containing protein [Thiomargarita sp.]|nr:filamentous hemagglutinin N-terminal domain-containing protein [Thiomargarita sp.]